MLKESTYPLLPHIRLQACGIGLAQVDQDQAVEDVGETLVHVEGQEFNADLCRLHKERGHKGLPDIARS